MNANDTCGCCEGIQQLTPLSVANRPGLDALVYRVGTYASFLETMLARLSNMPLRLGDLGTPLPANADPDTLIYPLQGLTTRDQSDPAIAMLAAWATVGDVLTFYQERIANEGYLRTATECRSILELARLVGYVLRPGVAASVFLAYTLEKDHNVIIQPGNRTQSVPRPGELPQSFETAEKLEARYAWNALKPRLTRPQPIFGTGTPQDTDTQKGIFPNITTDKIYLQGTATKLTSGDALLLLFGDPTASPMNYAFIKVSQVQTQPADKRTLVQLASTGATTANPEASSSAAKLRARSILQVEPSSLFGTLVGSLSIPPSLQPRNAQRLERTATQAFSAQSDIHPQVLVNVNPLLQLTLYSALGNAQAVALPPQPLQKVLALRVKASLFGHNLPLVVPSPAEVLLEARQPPAQPQADQPPPEAAERAQLPDAMRFLIALDAEYKEITIGSWVVVERRDKGTPSFTVAQVVDVRTITLGGTPDDPNLGLFTTVGASTTDSNGFLTTTAFPATRIKVTVLQLDSNSPWLDPTDLDNLKQKPDQTRSAILTSTTVYAQSESLPLAEEPIEDDIANSIALAKRIPLAVAEKISVGTDTIELDGIYDGLKSGQRLIISGERTDVIQDGTPVPGIQISELVMLAAATQDVQQIKNPVQDPNDPNSPPTINLPGDKKHTFLKLAKPLAYSYKRDTVSIYANVVRATHGETRNEVLGSGDASKALQSFTLHQSPLTYVAAPTTSGVASSLQVRVNDILWHEVDSLPGLTPTDRDYITETDDADKTTVIFGNGQYGVRLPTGVENVKAVYRTGIGQPGNVQAGQISQLVTKPLGVKGVTNPLRASGGADRDSIISARRNVPLATLALDRLVSVQDYADFARTFAGIGKASADSLSNGRRQLVYLTIAGADNIPIDPSSDLYQNLVQALHKFGDPHQPLQVDIAEVMFLVISAHVRLLPDYELEAVEPQIRAALLDTFSFERRELGQPVFQSEVLSVIQDIAGVDYVDLEILGAVDQDIVVNALDQFQNQPSASEEAGEVEEPGESEEEEKAEEFLELLGLTGHNDVRVQLARNKPNPPPSFLPAQLVFLTPDIPDTLIITELPQ